MIWDSVDDLLAGRFKTAILYRYTEICGGSRLRANVWDPRAMPSRSLCNNICLLTDIVWFVRSGYCETLADRT